MSGKQWKRLEAVRRLREGALTMGEAARVLGLSLRQFRRVVRAVEGRGEKAIIHGNTGRAPAHRLKASLRQRVLRLAKEKYAGFNDQHLTEKLDECEGIHVSKSTVRRILREGGVGAVRRRRPRKHRRRRDRKPQAGMLILWDGSRHDWLEGRGPMLCLMGAIDDATGELLPGAHFVEHECAAGYLRVLLATARQKGLPWAVYMDRHGSLKRNDSDWTLAEELRGAQDPTHVGAALQALGIEPIYALSPQAKGRVERLWGTLQDRLCSELRLAEACTPAEAGVVLDRYLPSHNERFTVAAQDTTAAWRRVRQGMDLERLCAFCYAGLVANDNTVRIAGRTIDIPPGPGRRSWAKAKVELRQLLDGSWRVYAGERLIATAAPTSVGEELRAIRRRRSAASRAFRVAVMALK